MSDKDDELRLAILRLARRMRLERVDGDMTDGQLSALVLLVKEGPQSLGTLAELERITAPSMNRTVNRLVAGGFVTRETAADDARRVVIAATEAGRAVVAETKRRREEWFARQLATLDPDERAVVDAAAAVLRRLADG